MEHGMLDVVRHALMITGFVFMMLLVIEYLNVVSRGSWQNRLIGHRWGQYVLAAFLGATPGCLGAFAVVAMYSHGVVTLGAVVAAMIATSGDASFVMLAIMPKQALLVFGSLFVLGVACGPATDALVGSERSRRIPESHGFDLHREALCDGFLGAEVLQQWKQCTPARGILAAVLAVFLLGLCAGWVGPEKWNWIRVTLLLTSAAALFIVSTVPDHFLEEHLWEHVVRRHVPKIFMWTLAALVGMYILTEHLDLEGALHRGRWIVLLVACLVGLIPESGPHIIFVTLYAQGSIPMSILLASSIVQDGHGMVPVLAHSRRAFVVIKAINLVVGLLVGAIAMAMGF